MRTEFHERMQMNTKGIPAWAWLEADHVVSIALTDANAGKSVSVPSTRYKLASAFARLAPDSLVERLARLGR